MSDLLLNRKARIIFGKLGSDGKSVEGLRIKFKIEKNTESKPNKATIEIYNLNPDSRSIAERGGIITLEAGYDGRTQGIFIGDVGRVITRDEGADIVTQFECGDGEKAFQNKTADISFAPGTNMTDVFKNVTGQFGLPIAEMSGVKSESINNGMVVSGPIRNILDTLTEKQGLIWHIQDGQLVITKENLPTSEEVVLFSANSGMVGSPKKKEKGLEINGLLNGQIKPGKRIAIKSVGIEGQFKISKVTHVGDTHGQEWYTQCEIENIGVAL